MPSTLNFTRSFRGLPPKIIKLRGLDLELRGKYQQDKVFLLFIAMLDIHGHKLLNNAVNCGIKVDERIKKDIEEILEETDKE